MKKSILIIAAFVALAMLASCQKEQFTENVTPVTGVTEFTATIEQPTKTVIAANGKVTWKAGDEITVTDAAQKSAVYVASSAGASTTFTLKEGQEAVGDGPYTATYGDINNQKYDAAGANCPLTAPETSTTNFKFSSPYAVVKITAQSDGEEGETIRSVDVNYGENTYTLDCVTGVTLTSEGIDFFVSVEPATEAAALSVTFHTADKTATKERTSAVTLAAKDLLPVTLTFAEGDWKSTEDDSPITLNGVFTVSDPDGDADSGDETKVRFSQGNLRYAVDTKKWSFYEHQYDYATGYDANLISLFTWGYDKDKSILPVGTAYLEKSFGDLNQSEDWGSQIGDGNTWRTLTAAEWMYLSSTRGASTVSGTPNARYAMATVNDIAGIILLPDIYVHPSEVAALSKINTPSAAFTDNSYALDAWEAMESAGAVFLPAAGGRDGENIFGCGSYVLYWSSTAVSATDDNYASRVDCGLDATAHFGDTKNVCSNGLSVRLVTNVSTPAPEKPDEVVITRGTLGGHNYVGVNGVKWATLNLATSSSGSMKWKGARTGENPEAVKVPGKDEDVIVGDYFQWAAYVGYCGSEDGSDKGLLIYNSFTNDCCVGENGKSEFSLKDAPSEKKYYFSTQSENTGLYQYISPYYKPGYDKYDNSPASTSPDNKMVLDPEDDVAHILWGNSWRMPTNEEFQALYNVTYWAWDGTDLGYYVFLPADAGQSKGGASGNIGSLDKSKALLFFPCSGSGSNTTLSGNGYYWSSNLNWVNNAEVVILSSISAVFDNMERCSGLSIRPVSD